MAKTVRMSDIAEKLQVSTVTVSKALSDQKGVSEEVREKIRQLAKEMGYEKPAAKQNKKSYNIGVLVSNDFIAKYTTFYWEMYQAVNDSAVRKNCFVMLELLNKEDEKRLIPPKVLKENRIDALMVMGQLHREYLMMIRNHYAVPTVYMDFYDSAIREDSVISNSFYGTYAMTNYLFEMGHRKIAFVGTILSTDSITDRYFGYIRSLVEHGVSPREDWRIDDRDQERNCYEIYELPEDMPTAFVCNCDLTASKLIRTLEEKGCRVPEDVSVAGFDDFLFPGLCEVPLTTYAVNIAGMADSGIQILLEKLKGLPTSRGMHMIEGNIILRESVQAPRQQ